MERLVNLTLEQVQLQQISRNAAYQLLQEIKRLQNLLPQSGKSHGTGEDIAVVGIGLRFPGADGPQAFWEELLAGKDCIQEYPEDRARHCEFYSDDSEAVNKSYSKWGGFIEAIDQFATDYFKIPAAQARLIDPQQRLFLETACHCFQHAGYNAAQLRNSKTAVVVGARMLPYDTAGQQNQENFRAAVTGAITNFIATRVSDFFDLKGPSLVIDTACSSSLVAAHYACLSLQTGESDMALVGGVNLQTTPLSYIRLSNARALSFSGKSYVFDRRADGFVPGEGVGAILLKTLPAAIRDRDTIYAVIKGSACNNDGYTMGATTPNHRTQKEVLLRAYEDSGISPATISYIEAHGTGTTIGDPIELKALTEVFRQFTPKKGFCAIGSVKTNIGHLDTAAGIAGLIKVVLALYHRQIPPTLHCQQPNPRLNFITSPFYPVLYPQPWPLWEKERRAGISAFGFGGTNCHLVLQEAPPQNSEVRPQLEQYLLTLSANSPAALASSLSEYDRYLSEHPQSALADICYSANNGRDALRQRLALGFRDRKELTTQLTRLKSAAKTPGVFAGNLAPKKHPKVAFLFPGQGCQYPHMAEQLFQHPATISGSPGALPGNPPPAFAGATARLSLWQQSPDGQLE